jgi:hypothetical protein
MLCVIYLFTTTAVTSVVLLLMQSDHEDRPTGALLCHEAETVALTAATAIYMRLSRMTRAAHCDIGGRMLTPRCYWGAFQLLQHYFNCHSSLEMVTTIKRCT